jgi:hypothetical protein
MSWQKKFSIPTFWVSHIRLPSCMLKMFLFPLNIFYMIRLICHCVVYFYFQHSRSLWVNYINLAHLLEYFYFHFWSIIYKSMQQFQLLFLFLSNVTTISSWFKLNCYGRYRAVQEWISYKKKIRVELSMYVCMYVYTHTHTHTHTHILKGRNRQIIWTFRNDSS